MANQTRQLATLLAEEGLQVRVVQSNAPYQPAWLGRVWGLRALARLVAYRPALRALATECDVMHVMANSGLAWFLFAVPAIRAGRRAAVPVIVNYRGGLAREFLARHAARVVPTLKGADALVVPSPFLREVFGRHSVQAHIIPNVVDQSVFRPDGQSAERPGSPHLLITRNLEQLYGIDLAIRAAALLRREHPGMRLTIAGSGPERDSLLALIRELGLEAVVQLTGRLDVSDIARLYRSADLLVNPSRADNSPNSLIEALASGVPIVSTDVGGIGQLVTHGRTAWLVAPESAESLADGIAMVLASDQLRCDLRKNGLDLARMFGWGVVKQEWLRLYHELASTRSSRRAEPGQIEDALR